MDKDIKITLDFIIQGLEKVKQVNDNLNNVFKNIRNKQVSGNIDNLVKDLNSSIKQIQKGTELLDKQLKKKLTLQIDDTRLKKIENSLKEIGISFETANKSKQILENNINSKLIPSLNNVSNIFLNLRNNIKLTGNEIKIIKRIINSFKSQSYKLEIFIHPTTFKNLTFLNNFFKNIERILKEITIIKPINFLKPDFIQNVSLLSKDLVFLQNVLKNTIKIFTDFNLVLSNTSNVSRGKLINNVKILFKEFKNLSNIKVNLNFTNPIKQINDFVNKLRNLNKIFQEVYDNKVRLENNLRKDLSNTINQTKQNVRQLNQQFNNLNNNINNTSSGGDRFNDTLGRWVLALFGLSFGLSRVSEFLGNFYKTLIEITTEFEIQQRVLNGLIQSITITKKVWNELLNLALITPFTLREITEGYKNLLATGHSYIESLKITKEAIGVAIAFNQELSSVLLNIGRALEGDAQAWKNLRHQITLTNTKIKELGGVLDSSGRLILNNEEALEKNRQALFKYLELYQDVAVQSNLSLKQMLSNLEDLRDQIFNTFSQTTLEVVKLFVGLVQKLGFGLVNAAKSNELLNSSLNGLFLSISVLGKSFEVITRNLSFISDLLISIDSILVLMIAKQSNLLPIWIKNLMTLGGLLRLTFIGLAVTAGITVIATLVDYFIRARKKVEELQQAITRGSKLMVDSLKDVNNISKDLNENIISFSKGLLKATKEGKDLKDGFTNLNTELNNIRETLKKLKDEDLEDFKNKIKDLKVSELNKEDLEVLKENFRKASEDISFYLENLKTDKLEKNFKNIKDSLDKIKFDFKDIFNNIDLTNEEGLKNTIKNLDELEERIVFLIVGLKQNEDKLGDEGKKIIENFNKQLEIINNTKSALQLRLESLEKTKKIQQEILRLAEKEQEIRKRINKELSDFQARLLTESKKFSTELEYKNILTFIQTGKEGIKGINKNLLEGLKEAELLGDKWKELASNVEGSNNLLFETIKQWDKLNFLIDASKKGTVGFNKETKTLITDYKKVEEILITSKDEAERKLKEFTDEFIKKFEKILESSDRLFEDIAMNLKELARSDSLEVLNNRYNDFNNSLRNTLEILVKQRTIIERMIISGLLPEDKKVELERFLDLLNDRISKINRVINVLPSFKQKIEVEIREREKKKEEKETGLDEVKKQLEKLVEKQLDLGKFFEDLKNNIVNLFSLNDKTFKEILVYLNKNVLQGSNVSSLLELINKIFLDLKEVFKEDNKTLRNIEKLQKNFTVGVFKGIIDKIGDELKEVKEGIKNAIVSFKSEIEKFLPKQAKSITDDLKNEISKQREKFNDIWQKIDDTKKELSKARTLEERESLTKKLNELTIEFREAGLNLSSLQNIQKMSEQFESMLINQAEFIARSKGILVFGKNYKSLEEIPEDILKEAQQVIGDTLPRKINEELSKLQRTIEKQQEPEDVFKQAVNTFSTSITDFKNAVNELKNAKISIDLKINGEEEKKVDLNPFIK